MPFSKLIEPIEEIIEKTSSFSFIPKNMTGYSDIDSFNLNNFYSVDTTTLKSTYDIESNNEEILNVSINYMYGNHYKSFRLSCLKDGEVTLILRMKIEDVDDASEYKNLTDSISLTCTASDSDSDT